MTNNYLADAYDSLGFTLIQDDIRSFCQLQMTLDRSDDLFQIAPDYLSYELELVEAFRSNQSKGFNFRLDNINRDLFKVLQKTKIQGSVLLLDELFELKTALNAIYEIKQIAKKEYRATDNAYAMFCHDLRVNEFIRSLLEDTIDHNATVKDDASPELKKIRNQIKKTQNFLTKRVQTILLGAIKSGYAREDALPTISSGRMVIPVRSENKRLLGGVPHGESGSGQTAYVEPKELFEHNNVLQSLFEDETAEIRRILLQIVALIREDQPELEESIRMLVSYDFYAAKAKFAAKVNGIKPKISEQGAFKVLKGKNPILVMRYGDAVTVPFDLNLDQDHRVLLLTGPNAGGKSILLKSIGLLYLMFSSGILVPCDSESEFCLFDELFVDIGDNQSIDNELSTYSAHLSKMKYTLDHATNKSLVLVDEFGTGTEPDYGAALAESILDELNKKQIKGVFTTHFNSLKAYAENKKGVFNGAMLFNMKSLKPTFLFKAGDPGSSFALEIAKNMGLSDKLLKDATSKLGKSRLDYDQALLSLQDKNRELQESLNSLDRQKLNLEALKVNYKELKTNLENRKESIQLNAEKEALKLLKETQIELKQFKDKFANAKQNEKPELRKELAHKTEVLSKKLDVKPVINKKAGLGDFVRHIVKGFEGEVVTVNSDRNEAKISQNGFEWKAKVEELQVIKRGEKEPPKRSNISAQLMEKRTHFSQDLDVRGKRTEEALKILDGFINDAILLGMERVRVIHGKGEGILRTMIRNELKGTANVKETFDEHVDFGGAGITVVELA